MHPSPPRAVLPQIRNRFTAAAQSLMSTSQLQYLAHWYQTEAARFKAAPVMTSAALWRSCNEFVLEFWDIDDSTGEEFSSVIVENFAEIQGMGFSSEDLVDPPMVQSMIRRYWHGDS